MKNRILSLLIALVLTLPLGPAHAAAPTDEQQQQFTSAIDDLPLMSGLKTVQDNDVVFAEPHQGRIAETTATGFVDIDQVYNFYRRSLPHLGWKVIDGRTYEREGERLVIDARADGKMTTVRFSIKPVS